MKLYDSLTEQSIDFTREAQPRSETSIVLNRFCNCISSVELQQTLPLYWQKVSGAFGVKGDPISTKQTKKLISDLQRNETSNQTNEKD